MSLARKNDPELFTRVEKERRSGNLERMRTNYAKEINREIASKNRAHGIDNMNIDINELAKRDKPIARTNNPRTNVPNQPRAQDEGKIKQAGTPREEARVQTPSRIQKESRDKKVSQPAAADRPGQRVERTDQRVERPAPPISDKSRGRPQVEKKVPERKEEKSEKPKTDNQRSTSRSQRPQGRELDEPRSPRDSRFYSDENVR